MPGEERADFRKGLGWARDWGKINKLKVISVIGWLASGIWWKEYRLEVMGDWVTGSRI